MDLSLLERPNEQRIQMDLFYDYRKNVQLYPKWQKFLKDRQPKALIFWGQNDIFFTREGGEAYLADLPNAEMHRFDSEHFAVEDCLNEISSSIIRFYLEKVASDR
jgi:pimeloyl-ACP methyl ester carboxylesterase